VNFKATLANSLWLASCLPAYRRFLKALADPETAQRRKLLSYLKQHANTDFGRAHGFDVIGNYEEFARRVPVVDYAGLGPWIERIRAGEQNVLTSRRVTRLMPTSGTTSARKLIPMTAELQAEFSAAIGGWFVDLCRAEPSLLGGRAYWSITPAIAVPQEDASKVPTGFEPDTAYLNRGLARLIETTMAVSPRVTLARVIEAFRYTTVLELLRCRDLRFISVWHPSFLSLLLDTIETRWKVLLEDVRRGTCAYAADFPAEARGTGLTRSNPSRAQELSDVGPSDVSRIWKHLKLVSCWGDGASALALQNLRSRLPGVRVQPKGLIATEAIISIPFKGQYPVALDSHFFEFVEGGGDVRLASELRVGEEYEVVVTTGGGLWRYKVGDRVKVTGVVGRTPSIQFLGRTGGISDLCGEKLSEWFVADRLATAFATNMPRFALLAPDDDGARIGYTLYVEGVCSPTLAETLDAALRANPHYGYCRKLGQLQPLRLFSIRSGGYESFLNRQAANGARIGDAKPAVLSRVSGWSNIFDGAYVDE
jgi:hypothetical protein